jgi:hypothetical protein
MVENILLLVLSIGTIVAMALILGWFFRKLSRIEEEHWAEMAGRTTPRWAEFFAGKQKGKPAAPPDETESG